MTSIWEANAERPEGAAKTLEGDVSADVLVIGGGMAGMLCAYLLGQAGCRCVVAEARRVGSGATGGSSAKVTAQHGLIYDHLVKFDGIEKARRYYEANQAAVDGLRQLASEVPCDFEERTAYLYAQDTTEPLERERAVYEQLGIPHHVLKHAPLPLANRGALGMERQAQFNPLKLLYGLMPLLDVYEETFVEQVSGNAARTERGTITADYIVFATHYPLVNVPGLYFMKLHQVRSYVLALRDAAPVDGMFIGADGGLSFRTYGDSLLLGGGGHRTGEGPGSDEGFAALREFARTAYPDGRERFAWAAQDCMSLDKLPYIGAHRRGRPNQFVATGFNKWGMTGSFLAARAITDLITAGKSPVEDLFSPQRSMMTEDLFTNLGVSASNLVKGGRRCSHLGCCLARNDAEGSWDCPCHGSRFGSDGAVLDGPAKKPIAPERR